MSSSCATVVRAQAVDGYRVELAFSDGVQGVVDLAHRIVGRGGIFKPLEDTDYFRQVSIDSELGTIVWPNGADFRPDLLYAWATGKPLLPPEPEIVAS
jgi:hypothetical protein